ncbi:hypothetical protein [Streptomyces sp. 769]|uniref:hypothetical protein n=1 Tax=Streptomyces sp. 769 TaxID=1262452 RepID=UPI0005800DAE|nr:hypothetical protein [Streptomyces sp. 769]
MSVSVQVFRERGAVPDLWCDDRTFAVVVGRDAGSVVGSFAVLDLGAADPDLRFVGVVAGPGEVRVPLVEAAVPVVRDAGGRTLRWVEETGELSLSAAAALEQLGVVAGDEVHRWWRRELAAEPAAAPGDRGPGSPTAGGALFRVGVGDAWCDVEVDDGRAVLVHDRQEEGTATSLAALVSLAVRQVTAEAPGIPAVETCVAPGDEVFEAALVSLGFAPTTRRAVEYRLAWDA